MFLKMKQIKQLISLIKDLKELKRLLKLKGQLQGEYLGISHDHRILINRTRKIMKVETSKRISKIDSMIKKLRFSNISRDGLVYMLGKYLMNRMLVKSGFVI